VVNPAYKSVESPTAKTTMKAFGLGPVVALSPVAPEPTPLPFAKPVLESTPLFGSVTPGATTV
jgi:hypothetical protein